MAAFDFQPFVNELDAQAILKRFGTGACRDLQHYSAPAPYHCEPDILLGMDYYMEFMYQSAHRTLKLPSGLYCIPSDFGLLIAGVSGVSGKRASAFEGDLEPMVCVVSSVDARVDDAFTHMSQLAPKVSKLSNRGAPDVQALFDLETIGITDDPTIKDDDVAVEQFTKTITAGPDGRYMVSWPYKPCISELPENRAMALQRL